MELGKIGVWQRRQAGVDGVGRDRGAGLRDAVGRQQPVGGAGAAVPRALEHADGRHGDPQRMAARAGRRRRAARRAGARVPRALPARDRRRASRGDGGVRGARWPRCARSSTGSTRRRSRCRGTSAWRPRWGRRCSTSRRSARSGPTRTSSRPSTRASRASASGPTRSSRPELAVVVEPDDETRARDRPRVRRAVPGPLATTPTTSLRFGFTERDVADGGSDRLIDAVVPHGSAEAVAEAVRAHLDAGADHVALQPLGHGGAPVADYEALARALL